MREIKFRAWDKSNKIMHFNFAQQIEIEQYTGFKDSEGKEVYEGDIVKSDSTVSMEIVWYQFGWAFKFKNPDLIIDPIVRDIGGESDTEGNKFKYIKIIGNIHEVSK